jgi:hypothetical protein
MAYMQFVQVVLGGEGHAATGPAAVFPAGIPMEARLVLVPLPRAISQTMPLP